MCSVQSRKNLIAARFIFTVMKVDLSSLQKAFTLVVFSAAATLAWSQPRDEQPKEPIDAIETVAPDTRRELLTKFLAANPGAKLHALNLPMNAHADTTEAPGLRLNRMWVGKEGTLVEIEGLPVQGRRVSAVIRLDTFALVSSKGTTIAQAAEGATLQKDKRGGSALLVMPGEKLLALFEAVDDYQPMKLQHTLRGQWPYIYFENIDPRFRERYSASYQAAAAAASTPEQMKDFLVEFAANDPDGKAREVFLKLINAMRAQNTFEGFYNVYLLLQDPEDARKASALARSDEHRSKMEHIAVATLTDKNRLFSFDFSLDPSSSSSREGGCAMLCKYNFSATRPVSGRISVRLQPGSPIKLKQATYKVVLTADVQMPRTKIRESFWKGNYDGPDNISYSQDISVIVSPPNYSATAAAPLGSLLVAWFERGSAGGYEGAWATGDASIQIKLKSVELVK